MDYDEQRAIVGDWGRADAYEDARNIHVHILDLLGAVDALTESLREAVKGPDTQDAREDLFFKIEGHVMHALHHFRWMRYELGIEPEEEDGYPPPDVGPDGVPLKPA